MPWDAFNAAIRFEPKSALFLAGRCYAALALGRWDEGQTWLRESAVNGKCAAPLFWLCAQAGAETACPGASITIANGSLAARSNQ